MRAVNSHRLLVGWFAFWMGLWTWAPAAAEEIGYVKEVHPEVLAIAEGKPPRQLQPRDPLDRGLRVRLTQRTSYLLVYLYHIGPQKPSTGPQDIPIEPPPRIDGVIHLAGKSQVDLGNPSVLDRVITTVAVDWGELRVWLLPGRSHDLKGKTREAALGFKGTAVRVLADPFVGTFVGVDEGVAIVQALAGGDPVEVTSGHWVLVPPGGFPTRPASLDSVDILEDPPLQLNDFSTESPRPPQ